MTKKEITELVSAALDDHPKYKAVVIGKLPVAQAAILQKHVVESLAGVVRIIDTSGIRHALKNHGSQSKENKRGQIAINIDDFTYVPEILAHPDKIKYAGKNALKQDVFLYEKRIGNLYFVAEAVRFSKKSGNKLVFQTMYKRK